MIRNHRVVLIAIVCAIVCCAASVAEAQQIPESSYQELRWRMIGPFRGGRTRAAAGVPSEPNVFYVGQVNGGVWKTNDAGRTWEPIFDGEPTQSIGAIAVAPSDPKIVYVASGEGLQRPDLSVGDGIYKSTDAGKTWTHLGLRDAQQIPALAIDPRDPNRVFAAVLGHPYGANAERGIFRSTDGGQSWEKVLYKDENTGGSDVEIDPTNSNVVYASLWQGLLGPWEDGNDYSGSGGGLFKSTDGGTTWQPLTHGLPEAIVQINVAIAASDSNRLYATLASKQPGAKSERGDLSIYRSDDAGANWYRVTTDPRPALRIGGGDLPVPKVDPKNADVVYSTSIVTWKSVDGGKTWTGFRGAPGGDDYQNMWINPNDPKIILLVSDQGALVSVNGGETWSSWYNQPTAQFYHVETSNTFPYQVCSGQQESGSACILSRGNDGEITIREWHPVGASEYGYVAPDPLNADIVYGAGRNEVSRFHWSTWQVQDVTPIPIASEKYRTDRTQPLLFSPVDPHILYYTANVLFETKDGGHSWQTISPDLARTNPGIPPNLGDRATKDPKAEKQRGVIYALAPSFKNVTTIWAGTDDGLIWATRDGGKNWKDITPRELTAWSKVTQISASHFDDQSAYVSVSRFRVDDLRPYIYRTHDGGKSWQSITNGLPENAPVDTVREDSVRKGLLFAGTESAVWVSFDDGDHWQSLQLNLPHTSMRDLWIHDDDLIVATHGRSFWILDDITPLRQITGAVENSDAYLFKPGMAYRVERDTYTDTPPPPDEPAAQNPPDGAIIDYFLARTASDAVTIEIVDAQGKLARRYSSTDAPDVTQTELEKQLIPLYWVRMPKILPTEAGMHRWVWDLHYTTPLSLRKDYPIAAIPHDTPRVPLGPRALPGLYTVKLTVDGQSYTASLTVKMDPRVNTARASLEKQFDVEARLASMISRSSEAVAQARGVEEQVHKLLEHASASDAGFIGEFEKKLTGVLGSDKDSAEESMPEPTLSKVSRDAGTLYGGVDRADAAPTDSQEKASAQIERDFAAAMKRWEGFQGTDLPAMNRQLRGANLPEIEIEAHPKIESQPNFDVE